MPSYIVRVHESEVSVFTNSGGPEDNVVFVPGPFGYPMETFRYMRIDEHRGSWFDYISLFERQEDGSPPQITYATGTGRVGRFLVKPTPA